MTVRNDSEKMQKKTILFLILMAQPFAAPSNLSAALAAPAKANKAMAQNPRQRYEHLKKVTDTWDILKDSQVKAGIRRVMGNKEDEYWNRSQLLDDSSSRGDEILIAGDVRGLGGSLVSLLYINCATGRLLAGYNDGTDIYLYGIKDNSEMPEALTQYIGKNVPNIPIKFALADHTPLKNTNDGKAVKPLNLSSLTGTYERPDGRFINSTMFVEQLANGQIKFQIVAHNGGNSGQAQGTIKLVNNIGTYKEQTSSIQLKFAGGKVVVSGDDSYFCGNAVTLCGTYKKSADKKPKFYEE